MRRGSVPARMGNGADDHRVAPDVAMQIGTIGPVLLASASARPMQPGHIDDAVGGTVSMVEMPAHPNDRAGLGGHDRANTFLALFAQPLLRHEKAGAQRGEQRVRPNDRIAIPGVCPARRRHEGDRIAVRLRGMRNRFASRAMQALAPLDAGFLPLADTMGARWIEPMQLMDGVGCHGAFPFRAADSQRCAARSYSSGVGRTRVSRFSFSPEMGMERREAPGVCEAPRGQPWDCESRPRPKPARREDGIASSVRRRALRSPIRVRTGPVLEEAPPGAPPRPSLSDRRSCARLASRHDRGAMPPPEWRGDNSSKECGREYLENIPSTRLPRCADFEANARTELPIGLALGPVPA